MKLLFTLYRDENLDLNESTTTRQACRAIIDRNGELLLVKSRKYGEVKFPGGGVKQFETPFQTLLREVREETGYSIKPGIITFGKTIEYGRDREGGTTLFCQESAYYFCEIIEGQGEQSLDDYERDYGYEPLFIPIKEAIKINEKIPENDHIPWKERDTIVLSLLCDQLDRTE